MELWQKFRQERVNICVLREGKKSLFWGGGGITWCFDICTE
jgi:hypothetical protein